MARGIGYTYPLDQPAVEKQGVLYDEKQMPGDDKALMLEPEDPIRKAKGDLGLRDIKDMPSRALTHSGTPFKNLKGGK